MLREWPIASSITLLACDTKQKADLLNGHFGRIGLKMNSRYGGTAYGA
jgi:hypothetical protein